MNAKVLREGVQILEVETQRCTISGGTHLDRRIANYHFDEAVIRLIRRHACGATCLQMQMVVVQTLYKKVMILLSTVIVF
jgi:hypothetical protein